MPAARVPQWCGQDLVTLDPTLSYHLRATDGGTTSTLLDAQLPQLEGSALAPTIVTLTVGGNDLLRAYGDTRRAREVVSVVRTRVGQALVRVRSVMRQRSDPVIVGTIYDPVTAPAMPRGWGCRRGHRSLTCWPS
jgi:lysophospholipase L1-like esterase